jgi:hypothetical protein
VSVFRDTQRPVGSNLRGDPIPVDRSVSAPKKNQFGLTLPTTTKLGLWVPSTGQRGRRTFLWGRSSPRAHCRQQRPAWETRCWSGTQS